MPHTCAHSIAMILQRAAINSHPSLASLTMLSQWRETANWYTLYQIVDHVVASSVQHVWLPAFLLEPVEHPISYKIIIVN